MKLLFNGLLLSLLSIPAFATNTYMLADDVKVTSVTAPGSTETLVELSYTSPCWVKLSDLVIKKRPSGNTLNNNSTDIDVVLGVLLIGDKMNPCVGEKTDTVTRKINTFMGKKSFAGFKLIEVL